VIAQGAAGNGVLPIAQRRSSNSRAAKMVVMAGLVPAIHVLFLMKLQECVDARHKAGHDVSNEVTNHGDP
jgi:hypothetical protein